MGTAQAEGQVPVGGGWLSAQSTGVGRGYLTLEFELSFVTVSAGMFLQIQSDIYVGFKFFLGLKFSKPV